MYCWRHPDEVAAQQNFEIMKLTADAIAAERSRVATEGWGARLLALQFPAGHWGGPKGERRLLITLNSLVVLKDLGLDPDTSVGSLTPASQRTLLH